MVESADGYLQEFGFNLLVPDKHTHQRYMDAIRYRPIQVTGPLMKGGRYSILAMFKSR